MQTGAICPSLALLTHSALSGDPTHFTRTESHAHRKASSARRSYCSLIQRSWQTPLISLAQNHTHTHRQAPSAHRSRCSLIQRFQETPLISLTQNHMHTERRHLPIARVARSFSAFRRPNLFRSNRITCTQKGVICPSLALLAHSALSGDPTYFARTESHAHRK